jgi:hypothetical protein
MRSDACWRIRLPVTNGALIVRLNPHEYHWHGTDMDGQVWLRGNAWSDGLAGDLRSTITSSVLGSTTLAVYLRKALRPEHPPSITEVFTAICVPLGQARQRLLGLSLVTQSAIVENNIWDATSHSRGLTGATRAQQLLVLEVARSTLVPAVPKQRCLAVGSRSTHLVEILRQSRQKRGLSQFRARQAYLQTRE